MRRSLLPVVVILALAVWLRPVAATRASTPAGSEGLVGTWRLVSCEDWDEKGKLILLYGEHPAGYIVYDSTGHVFVQFMRTPAVPPWASGNEDTATTAEKLAAFSAYAAYFGTFTVDWEHSTVVHHVEGSLDPMYTHTDQPRPFVLHGDTLIIGDQKTWRRVLQRVH